MTVLSPPARRALNASLLAWYRSSGRRLSFRTPGDAWGVLVSEVMLQQTQASRVDTAWPGFMRRFPTPGALAAAPVSDVLRAWSSLGYNRRALALHRAAGAIVERHGGDVPADIAALELLPGVGSYTARAVAAIGFGRAVGAVDTNVRRVVGRVAGAGSRATDGTDTLRPAELQTLTDDLVDRSVPAEWTHAVMDVGALLCRPTAPDCTPCPLGRWCGFAALRRRAPGRLARRRPARKAAVPFPSTGRWLRGRVIQRLRDAPPGAWTTVAGPLGLHSPESVVAAIGALERDGLLERRHDGAVRLPSGRPSGLP